MDNPVYIIGNNALAYYLGAQMQSGGNRVIVIRERGTESDFPVSEGFSVKEDRSLGQKKHKLNLCDFMLEPAKAVIITSFANNLNTALSCISSAKIGNAPVICFTPLKDTDYLAPLMKGNVHPAFFHGYVTAHKNIISLSGRNTDIVLCPSEEKIIDQSAADILASTKVQIRTDDNHLYAFWEYFAPYALCSILSAAEDCKISDILKDKSQREMLQALADEFTIMAAAEGVDFEEKTVMLAVADTPANYVYPLHQSLSNGGRDEFDLITSVVADAMLKSNKNLPLTQALLKKLYNSVLNKTL